MSGRSASPDAEILVLTDADVVDLLDIEGCIAAMHEALVAASDGTVFQPARIPVRPPARDDLLGLMPVHRDGGRPLYSLKMTCIVPANATIGLDPHQGAVALFDGSTGRLMTLINAAALTSIRTACVSLLATRALARGDARTSVVVGAGHQARAHVRALQAVRPSDEIVVAARRPEAAAALAEAEGVTAASSIEDAVRQAEIVCTVTSATQPVIRHEWLRPGTHVNAVGACFPHQRELDAATIRAARLVVDSRDSARREAGDLLQASAEGVLTGTGEPVELGEVLGGLCPGRRGDGELTVFESLGLAIEDLAAAEYVERRAREEGRGVTVPF